MIKKRPARGVQGEGRHVVPSWYLFITAPVGRPNTRVTSGHLNRSIFRDLTLSTPSGHRYSRDSLRGGKTTIP